MSLEVYFLFSLAVVWIIFAMVQDLRTREIANWISFSLVIFALGFRFFYSLFSEIGFEFFYQGLLGLLVFVVLGHLLYYAKFFAGGDAKLMMALGAILPLTTNFYLNVKLFFVFLMVFLLAGAVYSLSTSVYLGLRNFRVFKKEFSKQFKKNKKLTYPLILLAIVFLVLGFNEQVLFYFGVLVFIIPYLYVYTKAVDESCMIKKIKTNQLTEGDWLYKDVKVGKEKIKASWDGLSRNEINQIKKKHREVLVRYGIQFSPVFLISLFAFICLWETGLWNSLF